MFDTLVNKIDVYIENEIDYIIDNLQFNYDKDGYIADMEVVTILNNFTNEDMEAIANDIIKNVDKEELKDIIDRDEDGDEDDLNELIHDFLYNDKEYTIKIRI